MGDNTNCVVLGSNNATFCGVTKSWQPREWIANDEHAFLKWVITPAICALSLYLAYIVGLIKVVKSCYIGFNSHLADIPDDTDIFGIPQKIFKCCTNGKKH